MIYGNLGRAAFARGALLCGVAGAALALPSVAWAQDNPTVAGQADAAAQAAAATTQDSNSGNQILVTATKQSGAHAD